MRFDGYTVYRTLTLLQFILGLIIFDKWLNRRNHFWLRFSLSIFVASLLVILMPMELLDKIPYGLSLSVIFGFTFSLYLVLLFVCYSDKYYTILFISVACFTFERTISLITTIITYIAPDVFEHINVFNFIFLILDLAVSALVIGIAYLFFRKKMANNTELYIARKPILILVALSLVVDLFFNAFSGALDIFGIVVPHMENYWNALANVLLIFIQLTIVSQSEAEKRYALANKLLHEKEKQFTTSQEYMNEINRKTHDLKYTMRAILEDTGKSNEIINETMQTIDLYDKQIVTGCDGIDILLNEKVHICKSEGITINAMVDGNSIKFIKNVDLYVMFGNLLDNAIRAVRKVTDPNKKEIYIRVEKKNDMVSIVVENHYEGKILMRNGLPVTTKKDKKNHGIGLLSLKILVDKYNGFFNIKTEEDVFITHIMIPITEE